VNIQTEKFRVKKIWRVKVLIDPLEPILYISPTKPGFEVPSADGNNPRLHFYGKFTIFADHKDETGRKMSQPLEPVADASLILAPGRFEAWSR